MPSGKTELLHDQARGLDAMDPAAVARLLLQGQQAAAAAVDAAVDAIVEAAGIAAACLSGGGRLIYAGAGSSGLMALADGLELHGTYGLHHDQVVILLAGGAASLSDLAGGYEDDTDLARQNVADAGVTARDCVICLTASGTTPYALAVAGEARKLGARVVGIANNPGAPLFECSDLAVLLETPPEIVSGSTRMGAGTAQKIALNMLSTLVGIHLGHVLDGHMVNLKADNIKLRGRACRIVSDIAGIDTSQAGRFLDAAAGSVKIAILIAAGAADAGEAERVLAASNENLRLALAKLAS